MRVHSIHHPLLPHVSKMPHISPIPSSALASLPKASHRCLRTTGHHHPGPMGCPALPKEQASFLLQPTLLQECVLQGLPGETCAGKLPKA